MAELVLCGLKAMRFRFIEDHRSIFPASRRQRSDLIALAYVKEQSRLSLGSDSRPHMTDELKEIGLDVNLLIHQKMPIKICLINTYSSLCTVFAHNMRRYLHPQS